LSLLKARIHKILSHNKQPIGNLNSLKKPDDSLTTSPKETLDILIPSDGTHIAATPEQGDEKTVLQITAPQRVERAIRELQPKKAPGPDEIRNEMISDG
jgi:hypothetical protein